MHSLNLVRHLGPAQDKTYLRAVSMANRHVPTGFDHIGNVQTGFLSRQVLVLNRLMLTILDQ
jgi:hypothetical protein